MRRWDAVVKSDSHATTISFKDGLLKLSAGALPTGHSGKLTQIVHGLRPLISAGSECWASTGPARFASVTALTRTDRFNC